MGANDKPFKLSIFGNDSVEVQIAKIQEAIEKDPKRKSSYYRRLFHVYITGEGKNLPKAFEYINLAIECCTDKVEQSENYGCLSLWYAWQDRTAESIEPLVKSMESAPEDHERVFDLGCAYLEMEDYKKALEIFEKLLALPAVAFDDINDWEELYYERMADLFEDEKDNKKANKLYNKLLKEAEDDFTKAMIYALTSNMYSIGKDYVNAVSNAKKAVKHAPDNFSFIKRLAQAQFNNKQSDEGFATCKMVLKLKSPEGEIESYYKRKYYIFTGQMYEQMNQFEEAINYFKKSIPLYEKKEDSYESLEHLCGVLNSQRRYEEAFPYLKKIIKLWPMEYPLAYTSLATYYYLTQDDAENAMNYLHLAAEANHQREDFLKGNDHFVSAVIYTFMGEIYHNKYGMDNEAIGCYNLALTCEPTKELIGEIYDSLYTIYMDRGEEEKAQECKDKRSDKSQLLAMFSEPFELPAKKTLDERLRNTKNTKEELEKMPYHFSNMPNELIERLKYKEKLRDFFENDLLTNPKYKTFFDKYVPFYTRGFIFHYVQHKLSLIDKPKWFLDAENGFLDYQKAREMLDIIELILQKKLFNMQLLWRAEQITIPGIRTSVDFESWENNPFDCPFIEPITAEETAVMKEFLLSGNYNDEGIRFLFSWQKYDAMIEEDEEEGESSMPEWYRFYDEKMNTGDLLFLPEIRGAKEEVYIQKYFAWKRTQPPGIHPPQEPYVKRRESIFGNEQTYTEFMELFEDDYFCTLHHNWTLIEELKDETYDKDAVDDALHILGNAEVPPIMEGGLPWHQAIINCAKTYKCEQRANALEEAVQDFNMKRELNIMQGDEELNDRSSWIQLANQRAEFILKGRELSDEPRDFNF